MDNSLPNDKSAKQPKSMRLARDIAHEYVEGLDNRAKGERHNLPSGFQTLDKQLPGWLHEGHLIVVAARPGMGKSAFAQQVAEYVAGQQRTAIFMTLEMSGYEIAERSLARRTGVSVSRLMTADLGVDDWPLISEALGQFSSLPFLIDDASFDISALIHKIKSNAACLEHAGLPALGLVVVDYLQLVVGKGINRAIEIGQVSGGLKRLAKELQVPVMALSQLNRNLDQRPNKRPMMSDLRESGSIEQDADLVLFIYRDDVYNEDSPDKGTAEIIAGKNRHGPTCTTKLAFMGKRIMFGDLAWPATAVPAKILKANVRGASNGRADW
jgi:replicative DNA helicase